MTRSEKIKALAEDKTKNHFLSRESRSKKPGAKWGDNKTPSHKYRESKDDVWKMHPVFDGYQISNTGLIKSFRHSKKPKILKTRISFLGYEYIFFRYNLVPYNKKVHHLVLETFVGPRPQGLQCAHLDGNPLNNNLSNLKWVTPQENSDHKELHGTVLRGKDHPRAKLNEEKVLEIIKRCKNGERHTDVAKDYGVAFQVISDISTGKRWKHVHEQMLKAIKGDG